MTKNDIKPIPKYIRKRILQLDGETYSPRGFSRFYAYLALWHKELIKITVAVRHYKKQPYCKQVAVHALHAKKCFVKDLEYNYYSGMGFHVSWYDEGIQKYPKWFEHDWLFADDKYYDPYAPIVNIELLDKLPKFQYSAYREYRGNNLLRYLRLYERFPQTEYLVKLGLHYLAERVTILRLIQKDKAFRKWLIRHKTELIGCYAETVILAYHSGKPVSETQKFLKQKKSFLRNIDYKPLKELFRGKLLERFFAYLHAKNIACRLYLDYFHACRALGLDMTEEKNAFPHDFKRWHDIRIDEYASLKASEDKKKRKELYKQFSCISQKYLPLQHSFSSGLIVLIAKSPAELIREGDLLNHCVGGMGYDQKMLREESLIFFLRKTSHPETPFVTLEYSITRKKVLQCYAYDNIPPEQNILDFVNNQWLPYANKQLKKIA
ncbi:MAG: PcfJ domain-containing protein [Coriobacteriales bacterium]